MLKSKKSLSMKAVSAVLHRERLQIYVYAALVTEYSLSMENP